MGRLSYSAIVTALLAQVCHACFTIDVAGTPSDLRTDCLRDGGDVWRPAERGCNIVPCGAKLNRDIAPRRFTVTGDEEFFVKVKLQNIHKGGQLIYSLKYGNSPDFLMTPGFEQEADSRQNVIPDTDVFDWVKAFQIDPLYNGNATLQVRYVTDGIVKAEVPGVPRLDDSTSASFYQCVDITVTGGKSFPPGVDNSGFGPSFVIVDPGTGVVVPPAEGLDPFWSAFIVLVLFILLCSAGVAYLFSTRKEPERAALEPRVHEPTVAPPKEPTPKRKTPTPSQASEEEDEQVAVLHYTDADKDKSQSATPTPTPTLEATGSQGRHFHFRYVEEDDA